MIPMPIWSLPTMALAALLMCGGAWFGGYVKGGHDNEAAHIKQDLAITKEVLADFKDAAKNMNGIAGQFTGISQDLNSQIGDISRKFRNGAVQHPLSPDCKPDTFRLQSLTSAVRAANTAAGRIAVPTVPPAQ